MTEREAIIKLAEAVRLHALQDRRQGVVERANEVLEILRATEPRESTPPRSSTRDESGKVRTEPVGQSALATAGTKPAGGVEPREVAHDETCNCGHSLYSHNMCAYRCTVTGCACFVFGTGKKSAPAEVGEVVGAVLMTDDSPAVCPRHGRLRPCTAWGCELKLRLADAERDLAALRAWADEAPVNAAYTEGFITHYDHWIGRRPDKDRMGRADGRPEEVGRG